MRTRLLLATGAATLALAAPAAAAPFTDVTPLSGPAGQLTLGGFSSSSDARIDWDVFGGVPHPVLRGRLYMDNLPGVQSRVRVRFFDDAINHNPLGAQVTPIRTGVAGIAVFGTAVGPQSGAAHAHVELLANGAVIDTAVCTMGVPSC
jgi:hypothetical protein